MAEKLNIFLSWSGERSRLMARALADWLPYTLQSVECWISDTDIGAGAQWSSELRAQLDSCSFGILCLTPENLTSPWLLFEAGYLAKSISGSRIVPYLHNLKPTDVTYPLAQFQSAQADHDGTTKLLATLNAACAQPMSEERIFKLAGKWWPDLDKQLSAIPDQSSSAPAPAHASDRDNRALLEEVLALVRGMQGQDKPPVATVSVAEIAARAAEAATKAAQLTQRPIPPPPPLQGRVRLKSWVLQAPANGHETNTKKVDIPWEFPEYEASPVAPKYPPFLSIEDLKLLREDQLADYGAILDVAHTLSWNEGFDRSLEKAQKRLREERARRQRSFEKP